jgi:hypothetical protein
MNWNRIKAGLWLLLLLLFWLTVILLVSHLMAGSGGVR